MKVTNKEFGKWEHQDITAYTLVNNKGMKVTCLNYGCIITEILAPDREGHLENLVLGFDTIEEYKESSPFFGAVVGRVAGRIKDGRFQLNGKEYVLAQNENSNHLHGGIKGFNDVIWECEPYTNESAAGICFSYTSRDGEEGYPGNLEVQVVYELNNQNELSITYEAKTDQDTLVNLTNHTYFNLSGDLRRDCREHVLQLNSSRFLELDEQLLPTGKKLEAAGTPFDFRKGRKILDGITSEHPQNVLAGHGYDHPFVFDEQTEGKAVLTDLESGRILIVETDQPCAVVYTSNHLKGSFNIRGAKAQPYLGICLETQGLPDAIHHPDFPSIVLEKDAVYHAETKYTFHVQ